MRPFLTLNPRTVIPTEVEESLTSFCFVALSA